jgi:hypothetical protein
MATTWEQINIYVGTRFGEEITNTLRNGKEEPIPKPTIPDSVMQAHQAKLAAMEARTRRLIAANEIAVQELEDQLAAAEAAADPTAQICIQLAEVQNKIDELEDSLNNPPEPVLEGEDKAVNIGEWKTYSHKLAKYNDQSNQVFSLVLGQCTQVLKDK